MKNLHTLIGALFLLSTGFYLLIGGESSSFIALVSLFAVQSVLLFFLFKLSGDNILRSIWLLALIANALIAFSEPVFEDDYWRYLWDGKVISAGINPYIYAPDSENLDSLHTDYREKINYLNIKTIYPPVAQYIFFLNVKIFGEFLMGLKFIFVLFHLLTGIVLYKWMLLRGVHPKWLLLYLLHPTALKEIANSAHVDSAMVFFLTLSCFFLDNGVMRNKYREFFSWFFLSLSALTKVIPIVLVPTFLSKSKKPLQGLFIFFVTLLVFSSPFLGAGRDFISGLVPFSKYWVTNESLFYPISYMTNSLLRALSFSQSPEYINFIDKEYPARILVALLFMLLVSYRFFKSIKAKSVDVAQEVLWIIVSLLILAPTFNPWYSLWFLPFAVLKRNKPLIILSGLTVLSYGWYWNKEIILKLQIIEYSLFFIIFYYFNFWKTRRI